jgi:hypothetical protein
MNAPAVAVWAMIAFALNNPLAPKTTPAQD